MCQLINGRTARKRDYVDENTGFKILKFRDLTTEGEISWSNEEAGYVQGNTSWRVALRGDVLVTSAAHSPEQIGRKVGYLAEIPAGIEQVCFTAELMVIRCDPPVLDGRWVYFWLRSEAGFQQVQNQVKEKHLVKSRASEICVPLAPLDEQRRIVARVEMLMERLREAKRLRGGASSEAGQLLEMTLLEAFDGSNKWDVYRLGDLVAIRARLVDPTMAEYRTLPHIGGDNIEPVTGQLGLYRSAETDQVRSGKYLFSGGEILYSKIRPYLRKAALVSFPGLCSADIYPLEVLRNDTLLPAFLRWTLVSQPFTQYAVTLSGRARMPKLNRDQLFAYPIRLPNAAEQRRMVAYLGQVQAQVAALKEVQGDTAAELQRLEQAILERAFRGES